MVQKKILKLFFEFETFITSEVDFINIYARNFFACKIQHLFGWMAFGKWLLANSVWQIAFAEWRLPNGVCWMAFAKWCLVNVFWWLTFDKWRLANGAWIWRVLPELWFSVSVNESLVKLNGEFSTKPSAPFFLAEMFGEIDPRSNNLG